VSCYCECVFEICHVYNKSAAALSCSFALYMICSLFGPYFQTYIELSIYTYQSTDAIRKRHLYIHISRLMQSENGILLLFYIFLSHGNGGKK
jgi:hypothetical protein